jgi:acyl-coenzyme A thioesterase PaaI-like protein
VPIPEDVEVTFPQDGGCFGCSPSNPAGLHIRFRRRGERIVSRHAIPDRFHGAPGVAHGGIVAAVLDEASCAAIFFTTDRWVVTGELAVRYERPVLVDTPLDVSAIVVDRSHPRYWVVEAEIQRDGERLARSTGKFFLRDDAPAAP